MARTGQMKHVEQTQGGIILRVVQVQGWHLGAKALNSAPWVPHSPPPLVLTLLLGEAGIEQGLKERKKLNGWGDEAVFSAQD